MRRSAWGILLSCLVILGCGETATQEAVEGPAFDESVALEKFDSTDADDMPPKDSDVDPLLMKPDEKEQLQDYVDDNPVIKSWPRDIVMGTNRVPAAPDIKPELRTAAGNAGEGVAFGERGAGHRKAMVEGSSSDRDHTIDRRASIVSDRGSGPDLSPGPGPGPGPGPAWDTGPGPGPSVVDHLLTSEPTTIVVDRPVRADQHVVIVNGRSDAIVVAGDMRAPATTDSGGTTAAGRPAEIRQPNCLPEQQTAETWKPSRATPNSSRLMVGDNEQLPLKGMQVDVRIDGFRARVVLDLYYYNDRPRQLEGNFQLRLPDEASPYFMAFGRTVYQAPRIKPHDSMFFKREQVAQGDTTPQQILALRSSSWERPKVARMTPRDKAAFAYRETVRRRVDPALVEWSGAGVFQCRVFPLAPQSLHRVVIGYDVDLLQVGDDLALRLDLPEEVPACIVDFNIAGDDAKQVSLDHPAMKSPDGRRLSYRLIDPKDRPMEVRLRKPSPSVLTGTDPATGDYFATRVKLSLPETPAGKGAKQAVFLVDTSLSAAPGFPVWTKLLRSILENNRDRIDQFAVLFFDVESLWWRQQFVANTPENVEAVMQYADGLALEGATDLARALKEAAAPSWNQGGRPAPELFLLSDGAATWGEDRWPLIAASLKGSKCGPVFAYHTGLTGGDSRMLAALAGQTGGAVFSVVSESEIAHASTAHRVRPWRLTGVKAEGAQDVLVAGRPAYVFPNQQLLVVGRLTHKPDAEPTKASAIVFTLQQGDVTHDIRIDADRTIESDLAVRAYGQVATNQLETLSEADDRVATIYARHFRITGRTCSLLMLETEQDYARFNIKPEEDEFVVKDRPAGAIVAAAEKPDTAATAKTLFLDWFHKVVRNSQVRYELPASLDLVLEGLPAEAFEIAAPALRCKLRMQKDLPKEFKLSWQPGSVDYAMLAAEADRRLTAYSADDAVRVMSSAVEDRPGDAAIARDVAFSSMAWGRPGEAFHLLRRAAPAGSFEPVGFYAMAHCLEQYGSPELAVVYYELVCAGQWDARFGDVHNIAKMDYLRFLRRLTGDKAGRMGNYAQSRMRTLAAAQLRDKADLATLILWNTDGTDVDLHVSEPGGQECYYSNKETPAGGRISRDVTGGHGPELYLMPVAPEGNYMVRAHYFASDANRLSTRTKVLALIYRGWGSDSERVTVKAVPLIGRSEFHELATVKVPDGGSKAVDAISLKGQK